MSKSSFNVIRDEKGIVLLIALMVLIMLSLMGLAAILTGTTDIQIAGNSAHSTQALYLAEAGVSKVKSWFETPTSFNPVAGSYTLIANNSMTPYANGDMKSFFKQRRKSETAFIQGGVSQFTDTDNSGGLPTATDANNGTDDGMGTDQNTALGSSSVHVDAPALSIKSIDYFADGTAAGRDYLNGLFQNLSGMGLVTALEIYPPMDPTNYATVRVTAVDSVGAKRTIEEEIGPSKNVPITGGLSAGAGAAANGNASTHWGSVVVQGDWNSGQNSVHCKDHNICGGDTNNIDSGKGQADKWWSLDATGSVSVGGLTLPDSNYNIHASSGVTPQTLTQDQKDFLRDSAQAAGQYYVYCAGGALYKADRSGNPMGSALDFEALTNGQTISLMYVDKGAASCSPDTPPTFKVSGGYSTSSNIILDGGVGVDFTGLGGGVSMTVQNPDEVRDGLAGTMPLPTVHINGFLYTTGAFAGSGNPVVYGAVIAEGGYTGGGTPDIWYNANLKNGLPGLPRTSTQRWREVRK